MQDIHTAANEYQIEIFQTKDKAPKYTFFIIHRKYRVKTEKMTIADLYRIYPDKTIYKYDIINKKIPISYPSPTHASIAATKIIQEMKENE